MMLSSSMMQQQHQKQYNNVKSYNDNDGVDKVQKRIEETRKKISSLQKEVERRVMQWSTVSIGDATTITTSYDKDSAGEQTLSTDVTTLLELSEILFSKTSPKERLEYVTAKALDIEREIETIQAETEQQAQVPLPVSTDDNKSLDDLQYQCLFLRQCQEIVTILDTLANNNDNNNNYNTSLLVVQAQDLLKAKSLLLQNLIQTNNNTSNRRNSSIVSQLQNRTSSVFYSIKQDAIKIIQRNINISQALIQVHKRPNSIMNPAPEVNINNNNNYGNLNDAWECLLILSSKDNKDPQNQSKTPLDSVLWEVTFSFMNQVIQPLLKEFGSTLDNATDEPSQQQPKLVHLDQGSENNGKTWYCRWNIISSSSNSNNNNKPATLINIQQQKWEPLICAIQSIFTFFFHHVLEENPLLASYVGKLLFYSSSSTTTTTTSTATISTVISTLKQHQQHQQQLTSLVDLLRQFFWDHCFPTINSSKLIIQLMSSSSHVLVKATQSLEEVLKKNYYLQQEEEWLLTKFVKEYSKRYCEKKRRNVLMRARSILMHSDYHTTVQVGVDEEEEEENSHKMTEEEKALKSYMSIFSFPKCAISVVAKDLLDLVRETMKEAAEVGSDFSNNNSNTIINGEDENGPNITSTSAIASCCSQQLYRAARECLDVFRAVIPSLYRKDLYTLPRLAAIFHNDCTYLAHACTTLGLEFADQISLPICTFVDMVPAFRELGNDVMIEMIKRQRHEILMILSSHQVIDGLFEKSLRMNEVSVAGENMTTQKDLFIIIIWLNNPNM